MSAIPNLATLAQCKQYLSLNQDSSGAITSDRDDTLLNDTIAAYSVAVMDYLEWRIHQETLTNKVFERHLSTQSKVQIDAHGQLIIKTNKPCIQSVSAVSYKTTFGGTWTDIDSAYYIFDTLDTDEAPTDTSHQIRLDQNGVNWLTWRYPFQKLWFRATFVGGYATIPSPVSRACAEWIGYDYRLRSYLPTAAAGFISSETTQIRPVKMPPHLEQLLDRYRRKYQ